MEEVEAQTQGEIRIATSRREDPPMQAESSRRMRALAVGALLAAACCSTLALQWARETLPNGSADLSQASNQLAAANAEIRSYASELSVRRAPAPARERAGRKTQLWNAAANDEVKVDRDGRLTVSRGCVRPRLERPRSVPAGPTSSTPGDAGLADAAHPAFYSGGARQGVHFSGWKQRATRSANAQRALGRSRRNLTPRCTRWMKSPTPTMPHTQRRCGRWWRQPGAPPRRWYEYTYMYTYVSMHACMHVCVCVCVCVCVHMYITCLYLYTYVSIG